MRIRLRPATLEDARTLYEWRMDPETRKASWNSDAFSFESHVDWLKKSLATPDRKLAIAPEGTVRLDRRAEGWEIHVTVAPEHRGAGVGTRLIQAGCELVQEDVFASIRPENVRSVKAFERAGFVPYQTDLWVFRRET